MIRSSNPLYLLISAHLRFRTDNGVRGPKFMHAHAALHGNWEETEGRKEETANVTGIHSNMESNAVS